jgi:hypothetical protein
VHPDKPSQKETHDCSRGASASEGIRRAFGNGAGEAESPSRAVANTLNNRHASFARGVRRFCSLRTANQFVNVPGPKRDSLDVADQTTWPRDSSGTRQADRTVVRRSSPRSIGSQLREAQHLSRVRRGGIDGPAAAERTARADSLGPKIVRRAMPQPLGSSARCCTRKIAPSASNGGLLDPDEESRCRQPGLAGSNDAHSAPFNRPAFKTFKAEACPVETEQARQIEKPAVPTWGVAKTISSMLDADAWQARTRQAKAR